jgi:signal transduction histidine kinase
MNSKDTDTTVAPIRKRLLFLLLQSFTTVIILIVVLMLGTTAFLFYRVANFYPPFRPMLSSILESYYIGRGSWAEVESILTSNPPDPMDMKQNEWRDSILLDTENHILVDHGNPNSPRIGRVYSIAPTDNRVPLYSQGKNVGFLIITRLPPAFDLLDSLLLPMGTTTVFLAILTVVIGLLLTQRLINPLAEVIAAARAVTSGNLTTRVKVQGPDDLRVLTDSFNQMAGSLEKNDREHRNLIADIAHELRTPLSVLQGRLEGIVDGIYPADQEHIKPVLQETYQLERLIVDLDMLAQADSNQLSFSSLPVDLVQISRQITADFAAEAGERKITLRHKSDIKAGVVLGDAQRIGQVIINLVTNAIRYIPENGEILIHVRPVEAGIELTVSDNGPGIPEDHLPFIFNRFWRGEKSRSREWGGAGLGLAIASQFIEKQGGTIFAHNLLEGGLQVGFILPAAQV